MALPRETKMPSLLRRAILLACAAMMSGWGHPSRCCRCDAFSSALHPIPSPLSGRHSSPGRDVMITSSSSTTPRRRHRLRVSASERAGDVGDADDRSRPNIARIATHDEYLDFLRRDDRVCVISESLSLYISRTLPFITLRSAFVWSPHRHPHPLSFFPPHDRDHLHLPSRTPPFLRT